MITEYSMALNMLDAQERLDAEERLDQLEGDAWRYEVKAVYIILFIRIF